MGNDNKNLFLNKTLIALKSSKAFKAICCILISLLVAFLTLYFITNKSDKDISSYNINSEKVYITIDETNKAMVKEIYNINNLSEAKYFKVIIPLKSSHQYISKIKSIEVKDRKFTVHKTSDFYIVNIQSDSTNDNGIYEVSYVIDRGDDFDKELDFIDYYIASPYRQVKVSNFEFKITLPKNTKSSIDYIYNLIKKESLDGNISDVTKNDSKISLSNEGNVIQGKINNGLNAYEGLKIEHVVYENYYQNVRSAKKDDNKLIFLYIIFFFICFINFFICGKDSTMIYEVNEEIPKKVSPIISALLLCNNKDEEEKVKEFEFKHLSSLFIKWANEGFIHIERIKVANSLEEQISNAEKELYALERINTISLNETQERKDKRFSLFKKEEEETRKDYTYEYRFIKLKEPLLSDIPYYEKYIFDGIFVMKVNEAVDTAVIKANFGAFRECILYFKAQLANSKKEVISYLAKVKAEHKDPKALKRKNELKMICFLCWAVTLTFETIIYYSNPLDVINPIIFLLLLAILNFGILQENNLVNMISSLLLFTIGYFIVPINIYAYLLLTISNLLIIIMRKYTFQYELIVEKLKSFKKFTKKCKRVAIVNALNENPKYFYEALPHAIILGNHEQLIEKCSEFKIAMPGWLLMHPNDYSVSLFNEMINNIDETWNYIIDNTI